MISFNLFYSLIVDRLCHRRQGGNWPYLGLFLVLTLSSTLAMARVAPVINSTPLTVVDEESAYSYTITATDEDGDVLVFSAPILPPWLVFNSSTATLSGNPLNDDVGFYIVEMRVSDGTSSVAQQFGISVNNINDIPTVVSNITNMTLIEDVLITVDLTAHFSDVDASDLLLYSATDMPEGLSMTTLGKLTGAPTNQDAIESPFGVTVTVTDLSQTSASTFFQIQVIDVNDAPESIDDLVTLEEDSSIIIDVLKNDVDIDDTLLLSTLLVILEPSHGDAVLDSTTGLITYTPDADYAGSDRLQYRISDPRGLSGSAEVTITVLAVNDAPVAQHDVISTREDTNIDIDVLANDSDPDIDDAPQGSQLVIEVPPINGVVEIIDGQLRYTPNLNFNGTDSLQYKVADLSGVFSNVANVTISVGAVNDLPVAVDDINNTFEDIAVEFIVLDNDFDIEDGFINPATIFIVNGPANGSVAINESGTLTYTPNLNFNGTDSLEYTIRDSDGLTSNVATALLTISAVNDTPVAHSDMVEMDEDTVLNINVLSNDIDVDGNDTIDVTSVNIISQPSHGSLFIDTETGMVQYTPELEYFGSDSFIYNISDIDGLISSNVMVSIEINSVNDSPRLTDDSVFTDEDTPVTIAVLANDKDIDGTLDLTSIVFIQHPAHGTVTFNALGEVIYVPELNYHGNDLFSYTLADNEELTADLAASVLLTINSINDAPIADNNALSIHENSALTINLTGSDVDFDVITFVVSQQPAHGILTGVGASLIYTPEENYNGQDSFEFQTSDGLLTSSSARIDITVIPVNTRPDAIGQDLTMEEDSSIDIVLSGTDIDSTELSFILQGGNLSGTVSGVPPNLSYRPGQDFHGAETLLFFVNDGELDSVLGVINIEVVSVNDAPTADSKEISLMEDGSRAFQLSANDVDGDSLSYIIEQSPEHGELSGFAPDLTYTPAANYFGSDMFTFSVSDGNESSAIATVSIFVTADSDVPIALDQSVNGLEDTDIAITLEGVDPDGSDLLYELVSAPASGSIEGLPPHMIYHGQANFSGIDSFRFMVSDGTSDSQSALITINVEPVNDAPVAQNDNYNLSMAGQQWLTLDVLANDLDADADLLTLVSAQAEFGQVIVDNNQLRYVPAQDFSGNVLIDYLMRDAFGEHDSAVVQLNVRDNTSANGPVITVPPSINVVASGRISKVTFSAPTAVDRQGNIVAVSLLNDKTSFSPGAHTVQWKATDSMGNSAITSQKVNVFPLVSLSQGQQVQEGGSVTIKAMLNGPAPFYPLQIPFSVSGDATNGIDYMLEQSEFVFEQGTQAQIRLTTLTDNENDAGEQLIVVLGNTPYKLNQDAHTVTIIEQNVAPRLMLVSEQDGQQRFLIERAGGDITLRANASDDNGQDELSVEWLPSEHILRSNLPQAADFIFSAQDLSPGIYYIGARVTDNAENALSSQSKIFIEVVDILPSLTEQDSDGDLISDVSEGFNDHDRDHIADYLDAISDCNLMPESVNQQQLFLVEGQHGACLRRGHYSLASASGAIMLSAGDNTTLLPTDPDALNVGGLFDFEIHDINSATPSYSLVIPQRQPLPIDAVYRKYSATKGWYNFVEDDKNIIWSALGSAGVCPSPKASVWTQGLQQGAWCVQLTIEDGGDNDDDGLVNHSISDPGGIAVLNSDNQAPVAEPDVAEMFWNSNLEIAVLANDTDPDNDPLVIISAEARLGQITIIDGTRLSYQSLDNYAGQDVINYSISDDRGGIASSTLNITINANKAPLAVDDTASINSDQQAKVDVLANDSDPEGASLQLVSATTNDGTVTVASATELLYIPSADFDGTATIVYVVADPVGVTAQAQLKVTVTKVVLEPPLEQPDPQDTPDKADSGGGVLAYGLWMLALIVLTRRVRVG